MSMLALVLSWSKLFSPFLQGEDGVRFRCGEDPDLEPEAAVVGVPMRSCTSTGRSVR